LETTQGTLTTTQGELETTQGELTTTQGELETTQETLTTTQGTLTTTQGELETTQGTLTTTQSELETTKTQLTTAQNDLTSKEQALGTLLLKASVETVTELSAKLDEYSSLQSQVDGIFARAGVDTFAELGTKLEGDSDLQSEVSALLIATGAASLPGLQAAYNTAKMKYDTLNSQVQATLRATGAANLTALQTTVTSLRSRVSTLETQLGTANQQAQQAQTDTDTLSQQVEANTRGRALLEALGTEAGGTAVFGNPDITPRAKISATGTALKLEASPLTGGTSSVSGNFKGSKATLTRTVPGSGVKQRMVVYTDREVSRTFANHFGEFIVDRTASKLRFNANVAGWWEAGENMLDTTGGEMIGRTVSNISHGLRKPADPDDASTDTTIDATPPTTPKKSISARVLGVSGTFVCDNNGTACDITVTGTYYQSDHTDRALRSKLATLTLAPPDGGSLYFQPSSANSTISLRGNLKVGDTTHTTLIDNQYMIFGWWQSIPRNADGMYDVDVFTYAYPTADAIVVDGGGFSGTAEYEGPSAGVYAEERFVTEEEFGGVRQSIVESGEFTATVNLRADFDANAIEGNVSGFRTDHGAKDWRVTLNSTGNGTGTAAIVQADIPLDASTRSGVWGYQFLARHGNSLAENTVGDGQPIAAVGRFDARIENVRHLVGAFGAHRTSQPIGGN
jgi:peptidoglycan hydrolase CwlO-like protein